MSHPDPQGHLPDSPGEADLGTEDLSSSDEDAKSDGDSQQFESSEDSASDAGDITSQGCFPARASEAASDGDAITSPITCVTADFAMQNVLLQMGLQLQAPNGLRLKHVSRFVQRCSACFFVVKVSPLPWDAFACGFSSWNIGRYQDHGRRNRVLQAIPSTCVTATRLTPGYQPCICSSHCGSCCIFMKTLPKKLAWAALKGSTLKCLCLVSWSAGRAGTVVSADSGTQTASAWLPLQHLQSSPLKHLACAVFMLLIMTHSEWPTHFMVDRIVSTSRLPISCLHELYSNIAAALDP